MTVVWLGKPARLFRVSNEAWVVQLPEELVVQMGWALQGVEFASEMNSPCLGMSGPVQHPPASTCPWRSFLKEKVIVPFQLDTQHHPSTLPTFVMRTWHHLY